MLLKVLSITGQSQEETGSEADTVLISTLCAYINDNDKLIDNCLNFVETLEEQMMEESEESNNDFIGREKNESFEYVENCRDD